MPFDQVEKLKQQYTDKYVEVDATVAELRRFQGLTGQVKTVNMGGRALVQFDHPVDISWYDIEPSYLKVVDKPVKKVEPPKAAPAKPAAEAKAAPAKPTAAPGAKMSPLEMARAQAAAKTGGAAPAPAAPAGEGKPLSKLEQARLQAAAAKAGTAGAAKPAEAPAAAPSAAAETPAPAAKPAAPAGPVTGPDGKPLSKIELARLQAKKPKA